MRSARQSHVRVCKYMISPLLSRLNRSVAGWSWTPHTETEMESDRTGVMRSGEGSDDAWNALDDNKNIMIEVMIHGWWQMPQCSLISQITITVLYTYVHLHTEKKGRMQVVSNFQSCKGRRQQGHLYIYSLMFKNLGSERFFLKEKKLTLWLALIQMLKMGQ